MIPAFSTSLRRNPDDPRGLVERIDAQVRERLEEAVDFICLDLMVQLRRRDSRALPEAQNDKDRQEFRALVREFLLYLRQAYWSETPDATRALVAQAEASAGSEEVERLVAVQLVLARQLPDYWHRLDTFKAGFAQACLTAPPPKPGFLDRLLGR